MALEIKEYRGKGLSKFRTLNFAKHYAEIKSDSDAIDAFKFSKKNDLKTFVLGAGSNVFFKRSKIKSFVIKNSLPQKIESLGDDRFEVSSSVKMIELLKKLYQEKRDACYYLASAPCEIGGAIAMNAGTGPKEGKTISDFIESVKFVKGEKVFDKKFGEINFTHRHSEFTDAPDIFILSAVFKFPKKNFDADPIAVRMEWARQNQDLSIPNCGSLCNKYNASLMKFTRALFLFFPAGMSRKKLNWTFNKSDNPVWLRSFLFVLRLLHKIFRKELKFEIRMID